MSKNKFRIDTSTVVLVPYMAENYLSWLDGQQMFCAGLRELGGVSKPVSIMFIVDEQLTGATVDGIEASRPLALQARANTA